MLTQDQIDFYHEHGYLHIPNVYSATEIEQMRDDLNWMIETWANRGLGWTGPWRKQLMDNDTESKSELIAMHDLHLYSQSWMRGVTKENLCEAMADLLGREQVALHHSTMHVKPPETGQPFPMHQDNAFYVHADDRYVDVLVHLDDTCHDNGEIRFIDGSHKLGYLKHITQFDNGDPCTPHLCQNEYRLADTVAVPAKKGDVVCFNINTIHGSHVNVTDDMRRLVRVGYRHPENEQLAGQSCNRPNLMVWGRRKRNTGDELFSTETAEGKGINDGVVL